jgi:hypothetical protein
LKLSLGYRKKKYCTKTGQSKEAFEEGPMGYSCLIFQKEIFFPCSCFRFMLAALWKYPA